MSTGGGASSSSSPPGGIIITARFGYGVVGASIGFLLLLLSAAAFAALYFCGTLTTPSLAAGRRRDDDEEAGGGGRDEATLQAYPAMVYGEFLKKKKERRQEEAAPAWCSVCLERYGEGEVVRELPECGHVFHRGCVDPWLRRRATCPVCRCRTSSLLSPLP